MDTLENIPVFMNIIRGKTVCICHVSQKRCKKPCDRGTVTRDKYEDWQSTMKRSKYGR